MALSAGTHLGPYEIIEPIGKGGMGEVYRGRDAKLGRDVAIKVLPSVLVRDRARIARFQREAKLLASLNHPNVASIYGFGDDEENPFLVMELVDGETLSERIAQGPIPIDEAVPLFIQIAEGMETAHENSVIHRDLKPSNIKISADGRIKILDFGLAKVFSADGDEPATGSSLSPTLTRGTALGAILGTAAYMSPEQAKGKTVDRRTDVWAFGCCLYEALTGHRAFARDDVSETLASVLRDEPDWRRLPPSSPARLRQLLQHCLRKDAGRRLQHIGDARIALQDILEKPSIPEAIRSTRPGITALLVTALGVGVLAIWLTLALTRVPPDVERHLSIVLPEDQQLAVSTGFQRPTIAISPDGSTVAYVARKGTTRSLYLRALAQTEAVEVPDSNRAAMPFFSPDSKWVGFSADGKLRKAPLGGGSTVDLCDLGSFFVGGSWRDDDTILFASDASRAVMTIPSSGGTAAAVATPGGELRHLRFPQALPGYDAFLFEGAVTESARNTYVQQVAGGEPRLLLEDALYPIYVSTGHVLFQRDGKLMAAAFDLSRLRLIGNPVPVLEGLRSQHYSVSHDGTLVYVPGIPLLEESRSLVWVDREGEMREASRQRQRYIRRPSLSPDGRRVAITIFPDVWVLDLNRDTLARSSFSDGFSRDPLWSPDGTRLYYSEASSAGEHVVSALWGGSGETEVLWQDESYRPTSISADGRFLFLDDLRRDGISMLELDGSEGPTLLLDTEFHEQHPALSPNGRWLAYTSNESGRPEIFVRNFPALDGKTPLSTDGGRHPVWSRDGNELFYRSDGKMMAVAVASGIEFEAGTPELLFDEPGLLELEFEVSADGQRFLMIELDNEPARVIHVNLNWKLELERLAPAEN